MVLEHALPSANQRSGELVSPSETNECSYLLVYLAILNTVNMDLQRGQDTLVSAAAIPPPFDVPRAPLPIDLGTAGASLN
jgi:hypothetical protein